MSINLQAERTPERVAVRMALSGVELSYAELDDASARLAAALRERGAKLGDRLALLMTNSPEFFVGAWAARRAGLRLVPVNWHLKFDEAAHVVDDSDAMALIISPELTELADQLCRHCPKLRFLISTGEANGRTEALSELLVATLPLPVTDEPQGNMMPYSSGTSGRPKGILRSIAPSPFGSLIGFDQMVAADYGLGADAVYLCPAPLYHAAPLTWSMSTHALGGTVSLLESFDAELVLRTIERDRITHAQFVPTHFIRLLKLPEETRHRYDLSSLRFVTHAAAPCPVEVKRAMIEWWGPIIHEYYSGSEGAGFVTLDSAEWLAHPGSVGRPKVVYGASAKREDDATGVRIVDLESGEELPQGEVGLIYFADAEHFEYHKDPGKTAEFFNDKGWGTLGDMGWLDDEGYLYLADRKSHMIISGGVNIYPQEIEAALAMHPEVVDVAVIGVPNDEFGEEVKAVVQTSAAPDPGLADELIAFCRERIAHYKCPRTIDFVDSLPRLPNGKLLKRELRQTYWPESRIRI